MPNNQDTLKLLPCPFTGREARIDQGGEDCFYGVSKGPDQAEGPVRETYEAAVKAWNTRTPTPREQELEAQNKALWELVDWSKIMLNDSQQYMEVMGFDCKLVEFKNAYERFVKSKGDWEKAIQKAKEIR